jgi:predicted phosphate transport protein (TIGR00153 family)
VRFRLVPRDEGFFPLFDEVAANLAESARLLQDIFADAGDHHDALDRIVKCERHGDELTRSILRRLNSSFVTPFDREDIHRLAEELDDATDDVHAAADLMLLHRVEEPLPEMQELARLVDEGARATVELVGRLRSLKGMEPLLERIDQIESEADRVYRRCVARLFSGEFKAFKVLKAKDVVEALEASVNSIENVSDIAETILLKHA